MSTLLPVSIVIMLKESSLCDSKDLEIWTQVRNEPNRILDGLLEFPGGKIEKGETPKEAAVREWVEEVGSPLSSELIEFDIFKFEYKDRSVLINCFVTIGEDLPESNGSWYKLTKNWRDSDEGRWLTANHQLLDDLLTYYQQVI